MNQKWDIERTLVERSDGQRRWDTAYQLLLHWAMKEEPNPLPCEEKQNHASSNLCARINQSSKSDADN